MKIEKIPLNNENFKKIVKFLLIKQNFVQKSWLAEWITDSKGEFFNSRLDGWKVTINNKDIEKVWWTLIDKLNFSEKSYLA